VAGGGGDDSDAAGNGDGHTAADDPGNTDLTFSDVEVAVSALDLLKFEPGEVRVTRGEWVRLVPDNEAATRSTISASIFSMLRT
jgi:hypothetical protein